MVGNAATKIVGILNVTPDSFSDGGKFNSLDGAMTHLKKMIADGADVIDVGAESTRPGATPIGPEEEMKRLHKILPAVIFEVKKSPKKIEVSIDSYHFATIKKAYEMGVDIINDVGGLSDERIMQFIGEKKLKTILMHNLKIPPLPDIVINQYANVAEEILIWAREKIMKMGKKNIKAEQIIFDPGIGFGKNSWQSIRILKNIDAYKALGLPIYIGHSKKSFLKEINFFESATNVEEKTLIISDYLIHKNIDFLRVHDVESHVVLVNKAKLY